MNDVGSTAEQDDSRRRNPLQRVRSLGTSPAGESYEAVRLRDHDELSEDSEPQSERLVVKKLTHARLPSPEKFRQKFAALCRLEHPNLCPYRNLFLGEAASRITRDFVAGVTLDEFLLRPITDREKEELANRSTPESDDTVESADPPHDKSDHDDDSSARPSDSRDEQSDIDVEPHLPVDDEPEPDPEAEQISDPNPPEDQTSADDDEDRPTTLEIPSSLMEDSGAADRALDLLIVRLRRIIPQLVDALEYLHRFGHAHGNLTPNNIIITDDERVVLTDYGLYPELDIPAESHRRHAGYFAPECHDGEFLCESDLYSLGAILFEILADQSYGDRRHAETTDGTDPTFAPVYLSEIVPHCPATWVDLIHGLLAPEPGDRPRLEEVHSQLAATESRSVTIPAEAIQRQDSLYGRDDSLDRLTEAAKASSRERSLRLAIVEGGPGVGKTALLDALAGTAAQRGWIIFHGRCFHREPVSYQGWESVVDRLAHIIEDMPESPRKELADNRHRASRLFPQLASDPSDRPEIPHRIAVDGFRALLAQLSEQRPILICFDDIHWAGADSIRLLADLAEQPRGMRVFVAATWRERDDHTDRNVAPLWSELRTAPMAVDEVYMEGFSREEAHEYVLQHADHLSLRQKQQVLRRSGLNPLLIDELIHEFNGNSCDEESDDDATEPTLPDEPTATDEEIGHHLRPFIQQRLVDLSRAERLVVQLLTVASSPLNAEILARALERELGTQTADLVSGRDVAESLIDKRLARTARPTDGALSPDKPSYVVIHDLARRVILQEIGQDHYARLCGLIADSLAEDDDVIDDLRFEYLLRAGRGEEARRAAVLAARSALDRFAHHRAARLWSWLREQGGVDERDRLRFAEALLGCGDFQAAVEQLDALIPAESPSTDLQHRRRRIVAHLNAGNRNDAIAAADDAMRAAGFCYENPSLTEPLRLLPRRLFTTTRRWSSATSLATDTVPGDEVRAAASLLDDLLQASPLLITERRSQLELFAAHLALRSRFGPLVARDRLQIAGAPWSPFLARSVDPLRRWCRQASELARQFEDAHVAALCDEVNALTARHHGDLDAALAAANNAEEQLDRAAISAPLLEARLAMLRCQTHLIAGDIDAARRVTHRFLHRFRHQRWLNCLVALAAADHQLLTGALDDAERHLDRVQDLIGDDENCLLHLWWMDRTTRLHIARGRAEVAVAHWDLLVDRVYSRSLQRLPESRFLTHLNYSRSLAALATRQHRLREAHLPKTLRRLRRALRRLGDLQPWMNPFERTRFFRLRARFCLLHDRPRRALRNIERADEILGDDIPEFVAAQNRECRGYILTKMERPNGRTVLEEARQTYHKLGVFLPMVLDGWPVPRSHARLNAES